MQNIAEAIKTNMEIMRLIKGKYDEGWPGGSKTPEAKYYLMLEADINKARSALNCGGIAEKKDTDGPV